jgi:2-polyprenyl-6-hydroxyphenyl methylase / 3-demethylubiquinone-9 3-methyltransferase
MATSSNMDPQEIAKFSRLASRWWDPAGECKPLHIMNPVRANYIDGQTAVAEKRLLDIGCGGGLLAEAMAQRGAEVTAIDLSAEALQIAKLHALESQLSIDYQLSSAEAFAQTQPQSFDVVTCLEMLEHVPDPASVIKAAADLTAPGGAVYFSTLNRTAQAYGLAVLGAEYLLKMLPKGTHDYQRFIRPSELAGWCRDAGLLVRDITGLTYNPITQSFRLSGRDLDVNYLVFCQKPL